MDEPLMSVGSSALAGRGNQCIEVFEDRIEVKTLNVFSRDDQVVRFEQLAGVSLKNGVVFADPVIETRGGARLTVKSLPKRGAREAEDLIRSRQVTSSSAPSESLDIPAQIRKLAKLRNAGLITEEEFEVKKRNLLDRM